MSETERLLKKRDIARIMNFNVPTLERHIRKGIFPRGLRLRNGHLRWSEAVVTGYIKKQMEQQEHSY